MIKDKRDGPVHHHKMLHVSIVQVIRILNTAEIVERREGVKHVIKLQLVAPQVKNHNHVQRRQKHIAEHVHRGNSKQEIQVSVAKTVITIYLADLDRRKCYVQSKLKLIAEIVRETHLVVTVLNVTNAKGNHQDKTEDWFV